MQNHAGQSPSGNHSYDKEVFTIVYIQNWGGAPLITYNLDEWKQSTFAIHTVIIIVFNSFQ